MRKCFAAIAVVVLLARPAFSQDPGMSYFLFILDQIRSKTVFQVDEPSWLQSSLEILFPNQSFRPVSLGDYTQILEKKISSLSPDQKDLFLTSAIRSLLDSLPDPYAAFLSPEEVREEASQQQGGQFSGFGLELAQRKNGVEIAGFLPHSPAAAAGLLPGDRLAAIDGSPITMLQQAFAGLNPRPLTLSVARGNKMLQVRLAPGPIRLISFRSETVGQTGYVKMEAIAPSAGDDFSAALAKFGSERVKLIVLDLRDCVGGDVLAARSIAGHFLKAGSLLYTKESRVSRDPSYTTQEARAPAPLVILVDGATASAAELISGALQDHHAAILYGARTLGKGYIETTWSLGGGWALRMTTARYRRPSGREVQGTGVTPDFFCQGIPSRFSCDKGEYGSRLEVLLHALKD